MRFKTQFLIILFVFSIVLSGIAASVAITQQRVAYLESQHDISHSIEREANSLNSITIDYFLYQENLQLSRWEAALSSLSSKLADLSNSSAEQQMLAQVVAMDLQTLDAEFDDVTAYLQSAQRNVSVRIDPAFQFRWSNMAVQSQTLVFDAAQLSQSINEQTLQANFANSMLILSLVGTFGAFLATIYFMVFRKTLNSLTKLQNGIGIIGTGKLDYKINIPGENEITQLSHAFNQMTTNLKSVTASKADLETEIEERKKAEEALKQRTEELEQTQKKLEENAVQIEEYANQMEQLAEQRAKELQDAERMAAIGQTASMVGHDIRNPLQAMTGDLYLIKEEARTLEETDSKRGILESVESIEENIAYINKIVSDLQDYTRPIKPNLQKIDLKALIDNVVASVRVPQRIQTYVAVNQGLIIKSDDAYLKRILTNLAVNAVQAMPTEGSLVIKANNRKDKVIITVQDTGVGIPENVRSRLFTPLFTTKSKGQGLGLAVVKRLVEGLSGKISVESQQGKGTQFIIELPHID